MNNIDRIKEILGHRAPENLDYATETKGGINVPLHIGRKPEGWNAFYAERALGQTLAPLVNHGWAFKPGPKNFRSGTSDVLIILPPVEKGINTATLPLRDRLRVEAGVRKRKYGSDFVDRLEINEDDGTVTLDTRGLPPRSAEVRDIDATAEELVKVGWRGSKNRGLDGVYYTLTPPTKGMEVTQAGVNKWLGLDRG